MVNELRIAKSMLILAEVFQSLQKVAESLKSYRKFTEHNLLVPDFTYVFTGDIRLRNSAAFEVLGHSGYQDSRVNAWFANDPMN